MNFDKFINSKIFMFFDFLYKIIILNMLTVLTIALGLGVFSLMPALVSLIILIRSIEPQSDFPLVKTYINSFFKNYKRVILVSLFYLFCALVLTFNTYYFYAALQTNKTTLIVIGYYVTLVIDVTLIISFINACFIMVYFPYLKNKNVIKYSFILLLIYPLKSLIVFLIIIGTLVLSALVPPLSIFLFVSLAFYFINLIHRKSYLKLVPEGRTSLDAFMYISTNKEK